MSAVLFPWQRVEVRGPSMVPTLHDGDTVLARHGASVRPGDVVLARFRSLPDRLIVKRAQRPHDGGWWLVSDNPHAGGDSATHGVADVLARVVVRLRPGPPHLLRRNADAPGDRRCLPPAPRIRSLNPRLLRPQRWRPPTAPVRTRRSASTPALPDVSLVALPGYGPEDVVLDTSGRVLTGIADGRVLRIDPATGGVQTLADTLGRPLGLHACDDGSVLVCDSRRGLLRIDPAGHVQVLVDEVDGEPVNFASNVTQGRDGTIYFSTSSYRFDVEHYLGDILEHSGSGRLLRRRPSGEVDTLLDDLQFANGVVLAPDESFVVVAQTGGYCLTRYWLTGPRAGTHDALIDNLPGFPDNLSVGSDGLIWVSLPNPRDPLLDRLLPVTGVLRQALWLLPERLRPRPHRTVWVLAMTFDGVVVHDLQTTGEHYSMVTSVAERDGRLYLGSLTERAVAVTFVPRW